MRISGFSRNASDLYKIATTLAGFPPLDLLVAIHRRAPRFATAKTVESAMGEIAARHSEDGSDDPAAEEAK